MNLRQEQFESVRTRPRGRRTRWTVLWADRAARIVITVGGIGTVAAVLGVAAFLIWVAAPLFLPARVLDERVVKVVATATDVPRAPSTAAPVRMACDDSGRLAWILGADGALTLLRLDDGSVVERRSLFEGQAPTAVAFTDDGQSAAFGFADGSVRLGSIRFASQFLEEAEADDGQAAGSFIERTPAGQYRRLSLDVQIEDAIAVTPGSPVIGLDVISTGSGSTFVALSADGRLLMESMRSRRNLMTGKTTFVKTETPLPFAIDDRGAPRFVRLSGLGDGVYLAWSDGRLRRYDVRDRSRPLVAEEIDLVPEADGTLTQLGFLLGRTTLVAGDAGGTVRTWFAVKPPVTQPDGEGHLVVPHDVAPWFGPGRSVALTSDRAILVPVVEFHGHGSAVASLARSVRQRMLAIGYADGSARIVHVTSRKELATLTTDGPSGLDTQSPWLIAFAPRDDALLAFHGDSLARWAFDARHPETSLASLLRPVWYEGYETPAHVWQSSSGTDDFESKYGLMPLLFGTVKATVYSMLFGVPIALMAAIYTSEFLHPVTRARVKPVIEMMASLPSVVLGFIAALVVAPFIENVVPAVLLAIVTIPLSFLIGSYLWQLLPPSMTLRLAPYRLWLAVVLLPAAIAAAAVGGPVMERLLFGGSIRPWLDGQIGTGAAGWLIALTPLSAIGVWVLLGRVINPWLRPMARLWPRQRVATTELIKFIVAGVAAFTLAWGISTLLSAAGFDPRGSFLGTYDQRNALIVGFIMGFAIIPIVYTIADDALQAVPEHLRAASLGTGATPWQTAVRIIIPTAMSGLFSAVMIGLGRAVGETMIVLMAAGNTPVMEWNIFNGFRTLSANIAVELPEAVRNSTHYRTLFLAALVLFAMTFALNTVAEIVRQRFRKRAWQL